MITKIKIDNKFKAILSPEQYQKLKKIEKENKEKIRKYRGAKRIENEE